MLLLKSPRAIAALVYTFGLLSCSHAAPAPAPVPEPQAAAALGALFEDLIVGATIGAASGALKQVFGTGPTCCDDHGPDCRVNIGKNAFGHPYQACWDLGNTDAIIYDFDVDLMKCLIDLHYRQPDKCIDVKGSTCGANYGGGIMFGQLGWIGKGRSDSYKLSDQDSKTLQAAAESLRGKKISYDKTQNAAIELSIMSEVNGLLGATINFAGHKGIDC